VGCGCGKIRFQRVAADQLGQPVSLMSAGANPGAHLVKEHPDAPACRLPGRLTTCEPASDDCDFRPTRHFAPRPTVDSNGSPCKRGGFSVGGWSEKPPGKGRSPGADVQSAPAKRKPGTGQKPLRRRPRVWQGTTCTHHRSPSTRTAVMPYRSCAAHRRHRPF